MKPTEINFPMDIAAIQQCIPHRYPFLLVDRVTEAKLDDYIVGYRQITHSDFIMQGHFPGNPVVPGVLIVEGLAQIAAILGCLSDEQGLTSCMLTEVTEARFRKPVVPGDTLRYEVAFAKQRKPFFWFDAKALVDGQVVATVKFSAQMR